MKYCRISKSDLQFCNGCKMLKQVQHDKFYGELASPLVGEAEFQHEERVLEIQVRGNLRTSCIFRPLTRICSSLRSHNCGLSHKGRGYCCVLTTTVLFRQAHRLKVAAAAAVVVVPVRVRGGEDAAVRVVLAVLLTRPQPKCRAGRGDESH